MEWKLNDSSPIWIQLVNQMTERIVSGVYPMGEKISSVRELAAEAGVNPNTMQRALTKLDETGLTETNRTSGRSVTTNAEVLARVRSEIAREKIDSFVRGMELLGFTRQEIIRFLKGEKDNE